jgi:DNA repair exonuclease SbcCD ATPase subunit
VKPLGLICLIATTVVLAACGESAQQKAQKQTCSARSDLQKQVNELKTLTPATATTNDVKDKLNAIKSDLQKIADAQPQLSSERKKQVKEANDKFVSEFKSITSDLRTNVSVSGARAKLQAAGQELAAAYQTTFAKVDCSS